MAALYPLYTPERVLERVRQLEDVELPSLPSFQHDDPDFESGIITESESSLDASDHSIATQMPPVDLATPHPLRKSFLPPSTTSHSSGISSETSIGSPYPPPMENTQTPSPYAPTTALTSTPQTIPPRTISETSRDGGRPWQTPGELSRSFSGQEIQVDKWEELSQTEDSAAFDHSTNEPSKKDDFDETRFSRRLSSSNVVFNRRGKRPTFDALQQPPVIGQDVPLSAITSVSRTASSSDAPSTPSPFDNHPHNHPQARVPSLSRSEVSASEPSETASTPEGPSRNPQIATPHETRAGSLVSTTPRRLEWNDHPESQEDFTPDHSEDDNGPADSANQLTLPSLGSLIPTDLPSPAKNTPMHDLPTPGSARLDSRDRQHTGAPLSDMTPNPNTPMQFSSISILDGTPSKQSDFSTPRAPLDDIARRKSHVLAVLSSGGLPARVYKSVRGTPHPLRRVSTARQYESIQEESSAGPSSPGFAMRKEEAFANKGDSSNITGDNESFVSIASSADLTSDRRATSYKQGLSRGNTSFPTILLPTSNSLSSPGTVIRGPLGEQRADGIKIHKHLNAMNKQLLDTNAELAREAEAWKEEVQRLMQCLNDAGIQVEDPEIAAMIEDRRKNLFDGLNASRRDGEPYQFARRSTRQLPFLSVDSPSEEPSTNSGGEISIRQRNQSPDDVSDVANRPTPFSASEQGEILEEMAERLEMLEKGLDEKDQLIAELEEKLAGSEVHGHTSDSKADEEQADLRRALEAAEEARISLQNEFALKTEQHAKEFTNICAEFEGQVHSLESRLAEANETIREMQSGKVNGRTTPSGDDGEAHGIKDQALTRAHADLLEARKEIDSLRGLLQAKDCEKQEIAFRVQAIEAELQAARHFESENLKTPLGEKDGATSDIVSDTDIIQLRQTSEELRKEVSDREQQLRDLSGNMERLESELDAAASDRQKVVDELTAEIDRLNALLSDSNGIVAQREAELETARARQNENQLGADDTKAVEVMESHLEDAFREIGRLKHQLASGPHLQSALDARDARIGSLEREKAALQDRLSATREAASVLPIAASPFRATPFVNKAIASLRLPNTPGPLQELSWLHTTVGDANEPLLRARIDNLQAELNDANSQLDSNFSRLEAAGLSGLRLAEELATAQARILELEDELLALAQQDKASQALLRERRSHEGREGEIRIKRALDTVNEQMKELQTEHHAERSRILKENKRLTAVVSEIRHDHSKDLQAVRADADRELASKETEIRRLKTDLLSVQRQMDSQRKDIEKTAAELQEAEKRLDSQRLQYDRLSREQRDMSSFVPIDDHRRLVRQLRESLQSGEEKASDLARHNRTVEAALKIAEERISLLEAERASTAHELMTFERDLQKQQKESQRFGVELQKFKIDQQSKEARHALQLAASEREARIARERVKAVELELLDARQAQRAIMIHQQTSNLPGLVDDQRAKYHLQAQDLAIQIKYLKAKFTRESTFRNALSLQKRYLLLLVGGMSLSEQATLKQIAAMGFPLPEPPRRRRTLKAVGIAVLSLIRARKSASEWRNQRMVKSEAVAARVARKRVLSQ